MLSLNLALERLDKISKYFVLNSQKDLIFRDAYTFIMETVYHSVKSKITNLDAVSNGGQLIEMKAPFNFILCRTGRFIVLDNYYTILPKRDRDDWERHIHNISIEEFIYSFDNNTTRYLLLDCKYYFDQFNITRLDFNVISMVYNTFYEVFQLDRFYDPVVNRITADEIEKHINGLQFDKSSYDEVIRKKTYTYFLRLLRFIEGHEETWYLPMKLEYK